MNIRNKIELTLPHESGPNNIKAYVYDDDIVKCESDYELSQTDLNLIDERLGVKTYYGKRWGPLVSRGSFGIVYTTWSFLEAPDCDWE